MQQTPSRKPSTEKISTVNVTFSKVLNQRLKTVQKQTGAESLSVVMRDALVVYCLLVDEAANGNHVYIISDDGEERRFPVFD